MTIEAPPARPAKSFPTAAVTREAAQALIAAALTAAKSIGIAGGHVQQDQDAAEAALRALDFDVPV